MVSCSWTIALNTQPFGLHSYKKGIKFVACGIWRTLIVDEYTEVLASWIQITYSYLPSPNYQL